MTIFGLLLYSCVSSNGIDGELLSRTCRWDNQYPHYSTYEKCAAAGLKAIGTPVFSDTAEDRHVEKHKCISFHVE